jgi:hypothetical protein
MPTIAVTSYALGYNIPKNQFYFYYSLQGNPGVFQLFPDPQTFLALADMFRNQGPIVLNTPGNYFVSAACSPRPCPAPAPGPAPAELGENLPHHPTTP